ncbi:tetratricopeptide repeat protein [Neptunomonas sp.]|uniref:tetratricopeptide repeat protein n=1 Tax=Neptunomonas sp. TaxID=1971898 RepID=UPI0025F2D8EB|nr:tetratricopeptide repeat protein [Neptunomonas sp.]
MENNIKNANQAYIEGNYHEACLIYLEEANKGNKSCCRMVGWMLLDGLGTEANTDKALSFFERGSIDGNAESIFGEARCYMKLSNFDEALVILNRLAERDYPPANYWLGKFYKFGYGVVKNRKIALSYYKKAARSRHLYASREEAILLLQGVDGFIGRFLGIWKLCRSIANAIDIGMRDGSRDPRWLI